MNADSADICVYLCASVVERFLHSGVASASILGSSPRTSIGSEVWAEAARQHEIDLAVQQRFEFFGQGEVVAEAAFNQRAAGRWRAISSPLGNSLENFPHRGRFVPGTEMQELVTNYP
jgi:hypothetical protein